MDARESKAAADKILAQAGLDTAEARVAKRNIDARLEGMGLAPSVGLPEKLAFTRSRPSGGERLEQIAGHVHTADEQGAATALLFEPHGAHPPHVASDMGDALFEPSDLLAAQAVTGLATTAAGGTEVKFNRVGMVHVGSGGGGGVYWTRAIGASINTKWAPVASGMLLPYSPQQGLFIGTNQTGGIAIGGVLTLGFYALPPLPKDPKMARVTIRVWRGMLSERLRGAGSDNTAGALANSLGGGTDVTLGTFSDAGVGTQIFKAGTNLPVGGASVRADVVLNAAPDNTDAIWVAETSALAVASNNGMGQSGQDIWNIPLAGKLFFLANSGTQKVAGRVRS